MILALKILDWVKTNLFNVVVISFLLIIFLQRCGGPKLPEEKPTVKTDTVWVVKQNTVITKPTIVKTIPGKPGTEYLPNPNYERLVVQYQNIVKAYLAQNVYKDSIKIDSIGYIKINDTISKNLILGRKVSYSFKYPVITNTITLSPEKRNQLYYGGGVESNPVLGTLEFNAGLLLKNKKDQIFNIYGGMDTKGNYQIGVQSYWKINLNKKN